MKKPYKILFIISFVPIVFALIYSIYHMIVGIDTHMVCITDSCPTYIKGIKAFVYCFYMVSSITTYILCFIYQLFYMFKLRKLKK